MLQKLSNLFWSLGHKNYDPECLLLNAENTSSVFLSSLTHLPFNYVWQKLSNQLFGFIFTGVSSDAMIVAQHTTTMLRCTVSGRNLPYWFVNETAVGTDGECYRSSSSNGQNKTATLTVDGNCTFDIFDFSCKVLALPIYSTTLKIQG